MANEQLKNAKSVKNDEFYTRLEDINAELVHYEQYFKNKVVFMNCDDPTWSNFWRYFHMEFERLGLKKIISTHYESGEVESYMMTYEGGDDENFEAGIRTELTQNGDFRSPECIELLKEADIVVTNPPFSLFREYIAQLMEYDKKFIIMGNKNAITYKEFFPLLKDNKVWVGATSLNGGRWMIMPKNINIESDKAKKDSDGNTILNVAGVCWFTNLENKKRTEKIETPYLYSKKDELYPDLYPKYDNYDAINVDKVTEIPMDYFESWGVSENNFALLQQENWQITRSEIINGVNYHWIIPSRQNLLYERYVNKFDGYKTDIAQALNSELYCSGNMGVPITFFDKYNPKQFEIINANNIRTNHEIKSKPHGLIKDKEASITTKNLESFNEGMTDRQTDRQTVRTTYARIVVRHSGTRC